MPAHPLVGRGQSHKFFVPPAQLQAITQRLASEEQRLVGRRPAPGLVSRARRRASMRACSPATSRLQPGAIEEV
jgi:hypothetical protein